MILKMIMWNQLALAAVTQENYNLSYPSSHITGPK